MAPKGDPQQPKVIKQPLRGLKPMVTRWPHVPSTSPYPTYHRVDWAKHSLPLDTPRWKLFGVIRELQHEVLDRRVEQKKVERFMNKFHDMMANTGIFTVDTAAMRAKNKKTKPRDMSTLTKPTILGRLRLLTKTPAVIAAPSDGAEGGESPDSFCSE